MSNTSRTAIIDLGTNTFHLFITEKKGDTRITLHKESLPARIGAGGINSNIITDEGMERALTVLRTFRVAMDAHQILPDQTFAFGTSAIRSAENKAVFIERVFNETGIRIHVIDGDQEAQYIYMGVRSGVTMGSEPSLVMDIGGGSVEFIIGNEQQVMWKQSFEIGGQRLMEKFMKHDPMTPADVKRLNNYFEEKLIPLWNAVHQYAPVKLIGSSGSFDTLIDMDYQRRTSEWPPKGVSDFELSLESFHESLQILTSSNHEERLAIPGMIPLRVDMIVVAMYLIEFVLKTHHIKRIQVSTFSLKEGVLASLEAQVS